MPRRRQPKASEVRAAQWMYENIATTSHEEASALHFWPVYSRRLIDFEVDENHNLHQGVLSVIHAGIRAKNTARYAGVSLVLAADARRMSIEERLKCKKNIELPAILGETITAQVVGVKPLGNSFVGLTFDDESTKRLHLERRILSKEIGFDPRPRIPHFSIMQCESYEHAQIITDQLHPDVASSNLKLTLSPVEKNFSRPFGG